ncbi:hypothetical protein TrLO_g11854 [Triparma laevis f. longispina]|uniref:Uncharacterized protein n=1 Tax=Triparma laevis f. longispina TaxID=1714387 RepID=A0A9W7KYC3_9STRA|nr:hypothetical protein TrLO_g11854 [Triparma laevis f. longispina]
MFGMKLRSRIAKLTNKDLSHFLTTDVVMIGVIIGLGLLTFVIFASVRCDDREDNWRECNRTLVSQAGLSGMIAFYVFIKTASGVVPKRILEKHAISFKKVVAMPMNAEESVQAFGLAIALGFKPISYLFRCNK